MAASPNRILFTVDVEEFDTALAYGYDLPFAEQVAISALGMVRLADRLADRRVPATLFTTAVFALEKPTLMRELAGRHEIASHGYYHLDNSPGDAMTSKITLSRITGQEIVGFRRAQMGRVNHEELRAAGYRYDSSLHPTYLPGRYNHLDQPRLPFLSQGIVEIPASVTPVLRLPLFWLSLKNMPLALYQRLCRQTLRADGHLVIYVHPWEFAELSAYRRIPAYVRRLAGEPLLDRVTRLLAGLSGEGTFSTMQDFVGSCPRVESH